MKLYLLSVLLLGNLVFALDYTNEAAFSIPGCKETTHTNSPVIIEQSLCGPYSDFNINLPSITLTAATLDATRSPLTGGPTYPYAHSNVLTVNGTTWSSVEIVFRHKAEHRFYEAKYNDSDTDNGADFEMQILLDNGVRAGVLSFILRTTTPGMAGETESARRMGTFPFTAEPTQPVLTDLPINLDVLTQKILAKPSQDLYLNLWTYNGTLTYPAGNPGVCQEATWFIYGSELFIQENVNNFIIAGIGASGNTLRGGAFNARRVEGEAGGSGRVRAEKLCYTGFFRVTLGDNYGLWFGVSIIFFFFILTLSFGEKPITDPEYRENVWTHHALYSLYHYGNEIHTRKTRAALFMATLTIHGLFSSLWYEKTDEKDRMRSSNTIVYGVYSMIVSVIVTYFLGWMLRRYYLAKFQYHKTRDENWDQRAQNRIFAYYFSIFAVTVVGWACCVWKMNDLHAEISNNSSRMWVASFFIGLGLEFLIIDPIVCLLARTVGPIRNFAKRKAYMYDNKMHETYMLYLKMD